MPTSEHYRKNADDARALARETQDTQEREALLTVASQWDRLAEYKSRKEAEET